MNSLERELETSHMENEGLRKKQVKLDEQLMEVCFRGSGVSKKPAVLLLSYTPLVLLCYVQAVLCAAPLYK